MTATNFPPPQTPSSLPSGTAPRLSDNPWQLTVGWTAPARWNRAEGVVFPRSVARDRCAALASVLAFVPSNGQPRVVPRLFSDEYDSVLLHGGL